MFVNERISDSRSKANKRKEGRGGYVLFNYTAVRRDCFSSFRLPRPSIVLRYPYSRIRWPYLKEAVTVVCYSDCTGIRCTLISIQKRAGLRFDRNRAVIVRRNSSSVSVSYITEPPLPVSNFVRKKRVWVRSNASRSSAISSLPINHVCAGRINFRRNRYSFSSRTHTLALGRGNVAINQTSKAFFTRIANKRVASRSTRR